MAIPPSMHGRQLGRQLIATSIIIALVLLAIDRFSLGEDLAGDLLIVTVGMTRGVRMDLRAVDRDHPDLRQPRLGAQPQDVAEQSGDAASWRWRKRADERAAGDTGSEEHDEGFAAIGERFADDRAGEEGDDDAERIQVGLLGG